MVLMKLKQRKGAPTLQVKISTKVKMVLMKLKQRFAVPEQRDERTYNCNDCNLETSEHGASNLLLEIRTMIDTLKGGAF